MPAVLLKPVIGGAYPKFAKQTSFCGKRATTQGRPNLHVPQAHFISSFNPGLSLRFVCHFQNLIAYRINKNKHLVFAEHANGKATKSLSAFNFRKAKL